ncbi:hypothetical protein F7018_02170 [Tenacibaculum aiptasiae]|uniref:Uncharacterized protein n=1 Tax=Tenacibaculum aiptasiae TaxID=426481 RepID=A0A7J5AT32_9FLAO|nr:hypothetical protein [Tenacibaculum aiptasiae]KAB1160704.1 hypothetical protein F7018_02170 [Tenacibaculum aiptasiae]
MKKFTFNSSWLFVLIPIGIVFFVVMPEIQKKYQAYNKQQTELHQEVIQLDSLRQLENPTRRDLNTISRLETTVRIKTLTYGKQRFLYYKLGGMLVVFLFMFGGMFISSFLVRRKKSSPNNKEIIFNFSDFTQDAIGQQISWEATEGSGSNFLSEHLKKTNKGYKISSSSYMKFVAWGFFLVGANFTLWSFVEFFEFSKEAMSFMQAGKIFFTTGGVFLLVGVFLLISTGAKAYFHTRKRKMVVGSEIIPFQHAYAIQVLEKFIPGKSSGGYFCYEANLVTNDGKRFNLLNHGDKQYLLSDTVKISKIFNVPVWNMNVQ